MQVRPTTLELCNAPIDNINLMVKHKVYGSSNLMKLDKEISSQMNSGKKFHARNLIIAGLGVAFLLGIKGHIPSAIVSVAALGALGIVLKKTFSRIMNQRSIEIKNVAKIYYQMTDFFVQQQELREYQIYAKLAKHKLFSTQSRIESKNKEKHKDIIELAKAIQIMKNPLCNSPEIAASWSELQKQCRIYIKPHESSENYVIANKNEGSIFPPAYYPQN